MGKSFLSEVEAPVVDDAKAKSFSFDKRKVLARFNSLISERRPFVTRWKEIRDFQLPFLGQFDDDVDSAGRRFDDKVVNGVAWESAKVFAAGVMSGLTPPSRQWFRFCFSNEDLARNARAARALEKRQDLMMKVLASSNFYNTMHSVFMELAFGQCPLGVFSSSGFGVRFKAFPIGSYAFGVGFDGMVDCFVHKYDMTASQLEDEFGREQLPDVVLDCLSSGKSGKRFSVCWLVEKNPDFVEGSKGRLRLPFRSFYWLDGLSNEDFLYVGGFEELPVFVARFLVNGDDCYGKGPGWFAEGDSKMLQVLEMDYLKALELSVKPPMQAHSDTVMKGINLIPGGATIVEDLNKPIRPLFEVRVNFDHLRVKISDVESRIKRHYSADLFLLLDSLSGANMTAREVLERTQEKMQQLGPMVERLQFEFLSPLLERVYGLLERANIFEPFDDDVFELVEGSDVKIDFISPLAQAQKMSGLASLEQLIGFVGSLAQGWPEALGKVDVVAAVNRYAELLAAPAGIVVDDEEFYEQQKAKASQDAMASMAQAMPMVKSAASSAVDLSRATGQKLDLNAILGG